MAEKIILAIDCGTQSLRALLFSATGDLLDKSQIEYTPYFSAKPGWAEQDPEYFWQSLCQACQQLWAQTDIPKSAIKGVTLTTQRDVLMLLVEKHLSREILEHIGDVGKFDEEPGTGIALQIDVEDAVGVLSQAEALVEIVEEQL